jgi:amino acid adenylation domain-containing protein
MDGWCLSIILKEVFAFYEAFKQTDNLYLDAPRPYRDYITWLQQQDLSQAETFWRQALQGFTAPTPLILDRAVGSLPNQRETYDEQHLQLSAAVTAALQSLARQHHLTLNTLVQGVWVLLLSRYSGEEDVVFGATVSGRPHALSGVESMVGLFINTLPVRVQVSGEASLLPWLQDMQAQQVEREQYSYTPLVEIQGWSNVPRGMALFESLVVFENYPVDASLQKLSDSLKIGNLRFFERTNYPITVVAALDPELSLQISYEASRFEATTITRMLGHFQTLLEAIVVNPQQHLKELPLLTEAERHQLLVEWNDTFADYPQNKCIHHLFEAQVERTPQAVAVVFEDEQLTYHELNCRANQLAHHLQGLGIEPEVLVGICVERSLEMVVGLLGILKAGAAYVPLDPEYPQERLSFMLEDAQLPVLLTQQQLLEKLPQHQAQIVCLDTDWQFISQLSQDNALAQLPVGIAFGGATSIADVQATNLAYVIYTSGSTGKPKGVMIPHGAIANHCCIIQQAYALVESDRVLQFASINFDASLEQIFPTLIAGATLVLRGSDVWTPTNFQKIISHFRLTVVNLPTAYWQQLAQEWAKTQVLDTNSQLRLVIVGGDVMLPKYVAIWQQSAMFRVRLVNAYGPTETTITATLFEIIPQLSEDINLKKMPIGRPLPNRTVYILDSYLQPVPIGVPGELYIGGVCLAKGYLNRPELTQEKFIPNPFSDVTERLYKTGDLARYLSNGNIEYLGRIDNQVKIRGFRIELGEIEAVLVQHPDVEVTVVIAQEDYLGDKRLVAYVVPNHEQAPTPSELRRFLKEKLPDYMVPFAFVMLEALPVTPNGKVDCSALPAPEISQRSLEEGFVAPHTPTEEVLAAIWAEVLGVERVGIHDNFFELGGHSLLATQVISRLREEFQVDMSLRSLFEEPTVAGLSEHIEAAHRENQSQPVFSIRPVSRDGDLPLSFAQARQWFLEQLAGQSDTYNIPAALELIGPLHVTSLEQSLREIVWRHEILRTTFLMVNGSPVQVIVPTQTVTLSVIDLQPLPEREQFPEVRRLATEEAQRPFDLANGSLLRITLLRLGEEEHVLLVTMHHIVSDGWSIGIFIRELATLYKAFLSDQPSPLPALPIQYADFAQWQRKWLQGEVLESHLSYWQHQLGERIPVLELPTDRPRPPIRTSIGAIERFTVDKELTNKLRTLGWQEGASLYMIMLAALQTLLYRYTGQEDISVGTYIANRNRAEVESLIGFFVNTLVMRTNLSGAPTFRELLGRVRDVTLGAYAHQDVPFEKLLEQLKPERNLSYTPLFQVMLVLQNTPMPTIELPGLTIQPLKVEGNIHAHFDLTLWLDEVDEGTVGSMEYNTDLFDSSTIIRMLAHFQALLESVVANPEQRLSDLPLLTDAERNQLLFEWNDTKTDYLQEQCIYELFEVQAERTPDAVAVVFADQQLTYRELNCRANQLAHHLQGLGIRPEVLVGICVERSLEMVVGLLGILKAGGAYVPLDPAYPKERLTFMLSDSQVPMLLTQEKLVAGLPEHRARVVCLDTDWGVISQESEENPASGVKPKNLAYVIYTSGSTGNPKGVMIQHQSLVNFTQTAIVEYGLNTHDRVLQFASISFDAAAEEIYPCLSCGGMLVLRSDEMLSSVPAFLQMSQDLDLTVLDLPTAYWHQITAELATADLMLPKSLRLVIIGGELALPERVRMWQKRMGDHPQLVNTYGPTEATVVATMYKLPGSASAELDGREVPIGRAIHNVQTYVLDQCLQPVPIGVPGELHIGGAGLARGYFNRPELTEEKFIPSPFSDEPGTRLYKTGDLACYQSDGNIKFLGRLDNQVKIRGFRIELGEIEAALAQHPVVRETVVLAQQDAPSDKRLIAYVVTYEGQEPTVSELRRFLKEKLPEYMVPSTFVMLETLPLTPNGKLDRRALPAPDTSRRGLEEGFVSPRDTIELQLAQIWEDVLDVHPVGVRDNFFDLGGHSLLAVNLIAKIQQQFGKNLPLATLFQGSTIEHLAGILSQQTDSLSWSPLVTIQSGGSKRPFFCVPGGGGNVIYFYHLARYLGSDQPFYGLQAMGLDGKSEPDTRVEDIAARYIEALLSVQPQGPYLLGGHSGGGWVAFEMAQQLQKQGHRVDLVAILDNQAPVPGNNAVDVDGDGDEATWLVIIASQIERWLGKKLEVTYEDLQPLPPDEQLNYFKERLKTVNLLPHEASTTQARGFLQVFKANSKALVHYHLQSFYPTRITLLRASEFHPEDTTLPTENLLEDPTWGWGQLSAEPVEIHVVPGDHLTMMAEPHVQVLAERLRACLDNAQADD